MCNHHLVEPAACVRVAGWEKGQVENQVRFVRDRLFEPRPRFKSLAELNEWLEDRCLVLAKRRPWPIACIAGLLLFASPNRLGDPRPFVKRRLIGWRVQSNMCLNPIRLLTPPPLFFGRRIRVGRNMEGTRR